MKNKYKIIFFVVILLITFGYIVLSKNGNVSKSSSDINSNSTKNIEIVDRDYNNISLTLPFEEVSSYDSYKNNIYMSVDDNSPSGMANKVVKYDRKTKNVETLFTTNFEYSSVQGVKANQNWITWIDCDDFGAQRVIYIMNAKTRKITAVTNEKDSSFENDFPILVKNNLAWIQRDLQKKESYVMLRNLTTDQNEKIFTLNTHTLENAFLSASNENILFTDKKGEKSYCYVYNVSNKKLEKIQVPHNNIGWGEIVNDHQIIYLAFFNNENFESNKLVLFDIQKKRAKEFSTAYMEVNRLTVDGNNHVFVGKASEEFFEKYIIDNGSIKKIGEIKVKNLFDISYNNGTYLMLRDIPRKNQKLIITSKLP